jgi:hypothetical protein
MNTANRNQSSVSSSSMNSSGGERSGDFKSALFKECSSTQDIFPEAPTDAADGNGCATMTLPPPATTAPADFPRFNPDATELSAGASDRSTLPCPNDLNKTVAHVQISADDNNL